MDEQDGQDSDRIMFALILFILFIHASMALHGLSALPLPHFASSWQPGFGESRFYPQITQITQISRQRVQVALADGLPLICEHLRHLRINCLETSAPLTVAVPTPPAPSIASALPSFAPSRLRGKSRFAKPVLSADFAD